MKYVLGIDLGTSGIKALLLDEYGNVAEMVKCGIQIDIPKKGFAEQNPEKWREKTFSVIRELLQKSHIHPKDIEMVGLSGQMHGLVILDHENQPLRPAIIWSDQRTGRQVEYIHNSIGKSKLGEMISNPIAVGFYGVSLMWLKENEPENYQKTKVALLPKDYLRYALTGTIGTDITDASGTGLFDVSRTKWNYSLIELLGIGKNFLPECYRSYDIAGRVTHNASGLTGIPEGTPVVYGGSDHSLQALGNGIIKPGTLAINIGSGGQIFTPIQLSTYDKQLRMHKFCHVIPGVWNIIGATLAAGLSLNWFLTSILKMDNYDMMAEVADHAQPGSEGVIFVPYIAGERTPHMDPDATGMFFGLTLKHKQCDMVRAVMEGVVFSFKDCYEIFSAMGLRTDRLVVSGGGATNKIWRQIIADVFHTKVYVSQNVEEAALGAAMVAGIGAGIFDSFEDACDKCVKLSHDIVFPNPENYETYKKSFDRYKELYKSTKHLNGNPVY